MSRTAFISRVVLRNYESIGYCDVMLQPLTYFVGQNGAGKSNFLDALHFVRDALAGSLDSALNERGGCTRYAGVQAAIRLISAFGSSSRCKMVVKGTTRSMSARW